MYKELDIKGIFDTKKRKFSNDEFEDKVKKIYNKNKDYINEVYKNYRDPYGEFEIYLYIKTEIDKMTLRQALNKLWNSKMFAPEDIRGPMNLVKAMSKSGNLKIFQGFNRDEKGRYLKIDYNKFEYIEGENVYIYDNKIMIDIKYEFDNMIIQKLEEI